MARLLNDWLTSYVEYTRSSESPTSYHIWSGLSTIAAALQRKCFFHWGHTTIYPNQYIILVGPSGAARKGEPPAIARKFIEHIGVPIASQSLTRESLINAIVTGTTTYIDADGNFILQSPLTIISPELSVLVGQKDTKFLADLTDWYDSHDFWTYQTLKRGKETISGVCVNILGATAPDWLPSILPQEAIGGGFTSRIVFVVEEKKAKIVEDPNEDRWKPNTVLERKLQDDLAQIHMMDGEFEFDKPALELYKTWYRAQENGIKAGRWPISDPKFQGYCSRRATHIKKISMGISASRNDDMCVTLKDFERAKTLLEHTERKMSSAFSGLGRVPFTDLTEAVWRYIIEHKQCKRSELLSQFYRDIDGWTLEKIERILTYMKVVEITILPSENDALYISVTAVKEHPLPEQVSLK